MLEVNSVDTFYTFSVAIYVNECCPFPLDSSLSSISRADISEIYIYMECTFLQMLSKNQAYILRGLAAVSQFSFAYIERAESRSQQEDL